MLLLFILTIILSCLTIVKPMEYKLFNRDYTDVVLTGSPEEYDKFRRDRPCKFVTHGWLLNTQTPSVQDIKNNYQKCSDVNVITLDWSDRNSIVYYTSVSNTERVGESLGKKIVELVGAGVCHHETTHCIGHSLGAHVCANAGRRVEEDTGQKINRVTGLDPAGPAFEDSPDQPQLNPSDADFVDAIHTDSLMGYDGPLANADFYVNGGLRPQPGCLINLNPICSHSRAHQVYKVTICNPDAFPSTLCDSYREYTDGRCQGQPTVNMGEYCPHNASGKYYLTTTGTEPYTLP